MLATFSWLPLAGVVWRRLRSHFLLLLALSAGFTLAVGLVTSIPIYAESAGYRVLLQALEASTAQDTVPPFSIVYSYGGTRVPPLTLADYRRVDAVAASSTSAIELPVVRASRYASSDRLRLLPPESAAEPLVWTNLAFVAGLREEASLIEGDWPAVKAAAGPIDVLISRALSDKLTLLVDDVYRLRTPIGVETALDVNVRVAGIWEPRDPKSNFWFFPPSTFGEMLLVPEESFAATFADPSTPPVYNAAWYATLDGSAVRSADVPRLTQQVAQARATVQGRLPAVVVTKSPIPAMLLHRDRVRVLIVTLALSSVPLLALIAYFLVQTASMVVQRQQQEIAILRSRGSSPLQVVGLALGEGLVLGIVAVLLGVPLGLVMAQAIAWTRSFLRFAPMPGPPVELLDATWTHGALAAALLVPAILLPALRASARTIISYKQERARASDRPLWQRMFLDLLLLMPALYGYQQLRVQGMIGVPGIAAPSDDPFRNPLLLLAPATMVFALALLGLRLAPGVLSVLTRLLAWGRGVSLLMALRFVVRTAQAYSGPMLSIALTLSLAAFMASMARTLDQQSYDRARYRTGPEVRITDLGEATLVEPEASGPTLAPAQPVSGAPGAPAPAGDVQYLFAPVEDYLTIPGVEQVTRVGRSNVFVSAAGASAREATFLAVDPSTLAAVLGDAWRADYASTSLGALMNELAREPAGVLVSSQFAAETGLRPGDRLMLRLSDLGKSVEASFVVAGSLDFFPTAYPESGPFLLGNLQYSFDVQAGEYPYEIWIDVAPGTTGDDVQSGTFKRGLRTVLHQSPQSVLDADLLRPERQGLFGLLSVGFLAVSLVTIIGFLAATLLSFPRRVVELGMLRAIGLSTRQLGALLVWEQMLVITMGTALGTTLGVLVSRLFLPFLRVRSGEFPNTPPFLVYIAWDRIALVYAVIAGLLLLTVGVTLTSIRRMRIFEAVKLGEAV